MEEIVYQSAVPRRPDEICIHCAAAGSLPSMEIRDISENGVRKIVERVRSGKSPSLFLAPDECGEEGYLMLESSQERIFLQIWDAETETAWACFDPDFLDSTEEADIKPSDGQSVFPLRNTIANTPENRDLIALCVEWYAFAGTPFPGMAWMKETM